MTPEQINSAIAEACGWRRTTGKHPKSGNLVEVWTDGKSGWCHLRKPPNYHNDLNAILEAVAERITHVEDQFTFAAHLLEISNQGWLRDEVDLNIDHCWIAATRTAPQYCGAFLKTLGLWEETE